LAVGSLSSASSQASPTPQRGAAASQKQARPAHPKGADSWLLAANPTAKRVDIASARTGKITGSLTNITMGTHAGTIQLGGGRVALMDESKPQLDVVRIDAAGRPSIEQHYGIPSLAGTWERAAWMATDTGRRYIAVGSDFDGSTTQQVTLIDLAQHKARTVKLPVSQVATPSGMGTEEMEVFLVGSPLRLVISAGGHLDAYRLSALLNGAAPKLDASTPLSGYPHGPIANSSGTVIGSDVAVGVQTVKVNRRGFGPATFSLYPLPSVQSYRPLMAPDGTTAVGTQAGATAANTPADKTPALLTASSTRSSAISSVNLGTGSFTRAVATRTYAAAVVSRRIGRQPGDRRPILAHRAVQRRQGGHLPVEGSGHHPALPRREPGRQDPVPGPFRQQDRHRGEARRQEGQHLADHPARRPAGQSLPGDGLPRHEALRPDRAVGTGRGRKAWSRSLPIPRETAPAMQKLGLSGVIGPLRSA
jgi:hypothetical protein